MGGNALGWAFDPIGQATKGAPFWSSDNPKGAGKGQGGGGIGLPQELVNAQIDQVELANEIARQNQVYQGGVFRTLAGGANQVAQGIPALQSQFAAGQTDLNNLRALFTQEGRRRRQQELATLAPAAGLSQQVANVANQLGQVGQQNAQGIRALGNQFTTGGIRADLSQLQGLGGQAVNAQGPGRLNYLGGQAVSPWAQTQLSQLAGQARSQGLINQQVGLASQADPSSANQVARLGSLAMQNLNNARISGDIARQGNQISRLGQAVGQGLHPLRQQALETLGQAAQGEIPTAISNLFAQGDAATRDVLESQFRHAERSLMEGTAQAGGNLAANLGNLAQNRAISVAQLEEASRAQQRNAALQLMGQATDQGLTSPQQQAALFGQAGGLFGQAGAQMLGAEQARQGGIGLAGGMLGQANQQRLANLGFQANVLNAAEAQRQGQLGLAGGLLGQGEQFRQGQLGLAGNLFGQGEQMRQGQIGLGANILGNVANLQQNQERLRQTGLQGALGAMQAAAGQDLAGLSAQQAGLAQSQQMAQALAGQYGQNADQFLMSAPGLIGQALQAGQQGLMLPALPGQIMTGAPLFAPAGALGAGTSALSGLLGNFMDQSIAQQQAQAQAQQGKGQLAGTIGGAMIAAGMFT